VKIREVDHFKIDILLYKYRQMRKYIVQYSPSGIRLVPGGNTHGSSGWMLALVLVCSSMAVPVVRDLWEVYGSKATAFTLGARLHFQLDNTT